MNPLKTFFLDLLFPKQCLNCKREGSWLCHQCENLIEIREEQECPICKKTKNNGSICFQCLDKEEIYFDQLLVAIAYQKGNLIQKAIKSFKYRFLIDLQIFFCKKLILTLKKNINLQDSYEIIPVPLHPKRKRWRGFNQSELLAKKISQELKIPLNHKTLIRIKETKSQAKLKKLERENNIQKAFSCKCLDAIVNKKFILIDDVASSLATLNECAKVLVENGAQKVIALVIARG